MVHHVTMSYDIDAQKMTEVLRIGREKLSDKGHRSAKKRVDPLRRQTGMARADVVDKLLEVFTGRYAAVPGAVGEDELTAARELVDTKFGTREWLTRVP
jgi:lipoate-protein ligase A